MRAATGRPYDTAAPCPIAPSLPPRLTAPSRRCAPSRSGWLPCAPACASSSGRRASSSLAIGGNGGGYAASDLNAAQSELAGLAEAAAACVDRLTELGVTVKDLDLGLLDFPSERDGAEVLLCWHVGEETVSTWHGLAEGYAGRKPIDWDE